MLWHLAQVVGIAPSSFQSLNGMLVLSPCPDIVHSRSASAAFGSVTAEAVVLEKARNRPTTARTRAAAITKGFFNMSSSSCLIASGSRRRSPGYRPSSCCG